MSDLSPEAKAFIDAARPHEGPAAGERDQIRRALAANLAAGAALGAATKTSAAVGAASMAAKGGAVATVASVGATAKVALSLAVVGLLGGGALAVTRAPHHRLPAAPVAASTTANGEPLAGADGPPVGAPGEARVSKSGSEAAAPELGQDANPAAPASSADLAPRTPIVVTPASRTDRSAATAGTAPAVATQPSAAASDARPIVRPGPALAQNSGPTGPLASSATAPSPTVAPTPSPTSSALPPTGPASPHLSALDEEVRRLGEVQRALRDGDATRALRLLDAGGTDAGGVLRDEQRAARFLALCRLGRDADANAEAARLLAVSPNSPVALRVRKGCPRPGSR